MVPSITLRSEWHSPAFVTRTRTSVGPGLRTSTSSRIAAPDPSNTRAFMVLLNVRSSGPDDALDLGVGVQAEVPAVAPNAAHLEPAERRLVVSLRGVDAHVAGFELLRD